MEKQKLAIIGTGIAGMGCAHFLQHEFDITLFEQNDYIGGHTNTVTVNENGKPVYIDTGFMVFNQVTYPNLCRLFDEIGAPTKKTDMSFSVSHLPTGLEYCGSGISGLFAQRKNIFNIPYIKMLLQIGRFNKESVEDLQNPKYDAHSLGEYIEEKGFGQDMLNRYLIPMSSAVWSTPVDLMTEFPAKALIRFFYNHGFLGLNTQHQWYTPVNGSQSYRKLLIKPFRDKILVDAKVVAVKRDVEKVVVTLQDERSFDFDKVIFAAHGDQTLQILGNDATPLEKELLQHFKYQKNVATLHTDAAVMPKTKATWSSWNYRMEKQAGRTSTIYWMNRLQQVSDKENYFVSINDPGIVDPEKIIQVIDYEHPLFDLPAINAQKRLQELNKGEQSYFCGSYFTFGFHEDAFASAVACSQAVLGRDPWKKV